MENLLDNLGYNTYVLRTIRSVTECKKILLYNKNSFVGIQGYSRLNLYNLEEIFFNLLYNRNTHTPDSHCLIVSRDLSDPIDAPNIPFEYDCRNTSTNGFNIIIYIDDNENPCGYTEFLNIQGRVSEVVKIYLKFNIDIGEITLELNNSLYKVRDRLSRDFIGTELNKFSSSENIVSRIKKMPKDQKYTAHLSAFLGSNNKSNIFLSDRSLLYSNLMTRLSLLKNNNNIFSGEVYSNFQIGYYGSDIVLYSWIYLNNSIGYYYKITSLITYNDYKHTHSTSSGECIDTIGRYNDLEVSKDLLYCAGKYLVFRVFYNQYNSVVALFDTSTDSWVESKEPNIIVDPLDEKMRVYEIPKANTIQSYDTAIELFPYLINTYFDFNTYIHRTRSIEILKKTGDWIFIKNSINNLYMATCLSYLVYMTYDEYLRCIVINNNTILIDGENYHTIYHGIREKEYYTEKARCVVNNSILHDVELRNKIIQMCSDNEELDYLELYKKSEVSIVFKDDIIYNTILNSYRRQPTYTYSIPQNIIGAIDSIIFYIDQNNNINYI